MKIANLASIASVARRHGLITIVDNTFMTPYRRDRWHWDRSAVHSGTKYLGGHNDPLSGIVVTKTPELSERMALIQKATGAVLSPSDSWLMLRALKLWVLPAAAGANAPRLPVGCKNIPWSVKSTILGCLTIGHEIHRKQATGYGAVLSFKVRERRLVERIINNVRHIFCGKPCGLETLITYPAVQTHGDIPVEVRERIGVTDDLLRLSVGIEDPMTYGKT